MTTIARPHTLYRFFDREGALLYIGITLNAPNRFSQHRDDKPWWHEVAQIKMEPHDNRESVLTAERKAIQSEHPRYNIVHAVPGITRQVPTATPPVVKVTEPWVGTVVAFGLGNFECPVGLVTSATGRTLEVHLFSWLTGYFGVEIRQVPVSDIQRVRFAARMESEEAEALGYILEPGEKFWDMGPLGEFQTAWKTGLA